MALWNLLLNIFLCRYEDVHNGEKYVIFDGEYNYMQAAAKCPEYHGTLAMVADSDIFNFLLNLHSVYRSWVGIARGMFLDGSKGIIVNPAQSSNGWYCVSVPGDCPATMPWQPGEPSHPQEQCVGALPWLTSGVAAFSCQIRYTAVCNLPM